MAASADYAATISLRLPDGEKGNMHDAYVVNGDTLKLQFNPEDLLIAPDPKPMVH